MAHDEAARPLVRFGRPALAAVVLVQALGLILSTIRDGTPVGTWLFLDHLWPELATKRLEWAGTVAATGGSLLVAFARRPVARFLGAAVASAWCLALALAEWNNGGAAFTHLAVPAHATRIAAPLILALWEARGAAAGILRLSIASTFLVHGIEALGLHAGFVDYLLAADRNIFGLGLTQGGAEITLRLIGVHDVALALLVLAGLRDRRVLGWMAIWGAITALSRVVQMGGHGLHHTVVRVANGGLPLALLLLHHEVSMTRSLLRPGARLARAALPLVLLALPIAAGAQALDGDHPGHLRVVWHENPAEEAVVSWSTATAGSAHVVHLDTAPRGGDPSAYARTVVAERNGAYATGGAFYHHARITGLSPSTTYWFVVESDGRVSEERHFVTAPADDRPFRLLSGGDSRKPGEADRQAMNRLMARLAEADPGIIGLAHGGDYIQSDDDWEEWDGWLADHALTFTSEGRVLPIIPVRGNHEGDGTMYNEVFGFPGGDEVDYFATHLSPNVVLLNLDTNSSIGGDQAVWLEAQLQQAQGGRWIVPSYHRPAYPAVKSPSAALEFWVPLFERYDVDVVLESDGHVLKRTVPIRDGRHDPTGIVYVGEGGLGVPQREPGDAWYLQPPGMATSAHHVQLFSFSPDELKYEAIAMDGAIEDTYVFEPRRTPPVIAPEDPGADPGDTPGEAPGEEPGQDEPPVDGPETAEPPGSPVPPDVPAGGTGGSGGCASTGGAVAWIGVAASALLVLRRRRMR